MVANTRRRVRIALLAGLLAGCGGTVTPASPDPSPTAVVSQHPSGAVAPTPVPTQVGGTLSLRVAPANLGCDAMMPPYRRVTFHIDAMAADQVTAIADTGAQLLTYWSPGFVGSAVDPLVRDPAGQVVVTDGQVLGIPDGAWPRLGGYFVCPSTDALYVLLADPQ